MAHNVCYRVKVMNKFHKKVLENINISVERISFRKDKWGEIATVYLSLFLTKPKNEV